MACGMKLQFWKMDPIISSFATPVFEWAFMVPVKKRLRILTYSPKYIKDMKARMKQLDDTAGDVQSKWDIDVENTKVVSERAEQWLKDAKSVNERVESIPTHGIGCFYVLKRYNAGKLSCDVLKAIEDLETRESELWFTKEKVSLAKVPSYSKQPSTSALVLESTQITFESRNSIFNNALQALQSNNGSGNMIALSGMGGVGKSTMMEQLKKAVEDSKMFDLVVKVVLGENTNLNALQQAIAKGISHEKLTERSKNARARHLRQIFQNLSKIGKKKILVILDDLWQEVNLKDIGLANPLPNGFKLLLTSRDESICSRMGVGTDSIFKLGILTDAESRTLFFETLGPSLLGNVPKLEMIAENIVKKCCGLPLALKTIAYAYNFNDNVKNVWEDEAPTYLEHHHLQVLNDSLHNVFEMSYKNLKGDDDKAIFLLSGLFPDNFNIPIEDLMMYGWGLKLFAKVQTLAEARWRTEICVNNLILANLLTKSNLMGCVKMHDLVRAFVLSNFSKVKQASITNLDKMSLKQHTDDANESYERILLKCTNIFQFPEDFNYPNLSLLMLMDGNNLLKFPEDIYGKMKKLEVLSYENMCVPLLSAISEHSINLRTLCLRSCSLINDDIHFIGSLSNLETLSFANSGLRRLPSTIGKLKKLKLLDLTGCVDLCIDDNIFQNLVSLEELYMRSCKGSPIRFSHANCEELKNLTQHLFSLEMEFFKNMMQPKEVSFENLERFRISIGCEMNYDEQYSFRNTLDLVAGSSVLLNCNISDLFEKTEELRLQVYDMNHLENVSTNHTFSNLRSLHVSKGTKLTYLFTTDVVASGLNKLEELTVSECPIMRALVGEKSGVEGTRLQNLKLMSLKGLPNMVSLSENVSEIELPEMVELILEGLPNFTSIYSNNNDTSEILSVLNKKVVIPKLEKLDISVMENLKLIWPCKISSSSTISRLRQITVRECDSLINLFPSTPLPLLKNLEAIEVEHCGSIEVLFKIDLESMREMEEEHVSKLRSIKVNELGKLRELWRMIGRANDVGIPIKGFKGVESIEIKECKRFENIFTPITTNFDLTALKSYITNEIGQEINATFKGEISEMDDCIHNVTYPSYLLYNFCDLQHLELRGEERVEVVFEMDSQRPLLLPYLKVLELHRLEEMSHVWKCDSNNFLKLHHQPRQFPFQNLTNLSLRHCHKIKYLFSPLMVIYLSNLKCVDIYICYGIEEVIPSRDDGNEENIASTSFNTNTAFFHHLDTLKFHSLRRLKRIDGARTRTNGIQETAACWSLCQYPRRISIEACHALSSLIPWYAVGQMGKLEELEIEDCKKMTEVFEIERSSNNVDEGSAHAGVGTTLTTPTLKPSPSVVAPQLSNLKHVSIYKCGLLSHVFTFSTLKSLKQLKKLSVKDCKAIQVIVEGENEISTKDVVFPCLESLELENLPKLKGFFLGMNDLLWTLLDDVTIIECSQMMVFTSGQSKAPKLQYIRTRMGKYSLGCGLNFKTTPLSSSKPTISKGWPCSFNNLVEIDMEHANIEAIIPSNVVPQLQKLEHIRLTNSYWVEEVFEVAPEVLNDGSFNESQTKVEIPNLTQMYLHGLRGLKYIWKSNQWTAMGFPKLKSVSIHDCTRLEHVFTCSMVDSLVQLQDLHISDCDKIEVIVKEEEEECAERVMLPRLESLTLCKLPSLKGFCLTKKASSWPSIATPKLEVINTTFGMCHVGTDLNSFIKTKQEEGHKF